MRPSFCKAAVAFFVLMACCISLSFPRLAYALVLPDEKSELEIGAFNIQVFGESKVNKLSIRSTLVSILSRYDIVLIQEIRDDQNQAIYDLLRELNAATGRNFQALVSPRMGRGEMKEQYAYFFDADLVQALDSYVFDDTLNEFAREPYVARFRALGREFTLAGIHVAPAHVRSELRALGKVHQDIKRRYQDNSMFILGDFNADCGYYKPIEGFEFFDESPKVLVGDDVDTTVAPSSCAYDRVLGFGAILDHTSEATAYNFMSELKFDLAAARLISDHYPIEFTIDGQSGHVPLPKPLPVLIETPDLIKPVEPRACGVSPTLTPAGYCFGRLDTGRRRVAADCCRY